MKYSKNRNALHVLSKRCNGMNESNSEINSDEFRMLVEQRILVANKANALSKTYIIVGDNAKGLNLLYSGVHYTAELAGKYSCSGCDLRNEKTLGLYDCITQPSGLLPGYQNTKSDYIPENSSRCFLSTGSRAGVFVRMNENEFNLAWLLADI